jgi:hypothetical protein
LLITFLLLCVPLLIMPNASKGWSLPALYANLSCLSLLVAVNQSSCYGLAGIMGPDFIQALERGKGWTGVAVVVLRAFIKCLDVGEGGAARTGGTGLFFLAASLIVCLATAGYGALTSQAYSKALVDEYEGNLKVHEATPRNTPLSTPDATAGRRRQGKGGGAGAEGATGAGLTRKVKNKILLRIQVPLLTIFLVFTLCISCFPGVATTLRSDTWGMGTWFPLAMVAAYNTADLLGKTLPSYTRPWKGKNVWATAVPLLFVVALMVMEVSRGRAGGCERSEGEVKGPARIACSGSPKPPPSPFPPFPPTPPKPHHSHTDALRLLPPLPPPPLPPFRPPKAPLILPPRSPNRLLLHLLHDVRPLHGIPPLPRCRDAVHGDEPDIRSPRW